MSVFKSISSLVCDYFQACLMQESQGSVLYRHPWLFLQCGQSCGSFRVWPMFSPGRLSMTQLGYIVTQACHYWPGGQEGRQSKILGEILHLPSVKGQPWHLTQERATLAGSELKVLWGFSFSENIGPDAFFPCLRHPNSLHSGSDFGVVDLLKLRIQSLKDLNHLENSTTRVRISSLFYSCTR